MPSKEVTIVLVCLQDAAEDEDLPPLEADVPADEGSRMEDVD